MTEALITKLENFTRLSRDDKVAARRLCDSRRHTFRAGADIAREGDESKFINIVVEGWAWRYKFLEDGRRQVTSLFLPGDVCDLYIFVLRRLDHFIGAVTDVTMAQVPRELFDEITISNPRVLQALLWDTLVSASIQREWTVNLGQRSAQERIAHLFCETFVRLRAAGRTSGNSCDWPLRQSQVADAAGLSLVHVNRTIRELRRNDLVILNERTLTIPDLDALMDAAMFDQNYLHLDREGRHLDSNRP